MLQSLAFFNENEHGGAAQQILGVFNRADLAGRKGIES